jgi:hypothetical protein
MKCSTKRQLSRGSFSNVGTATAIKKYDIILTSENGKGEEI